MWGAILLPTKHQPRQHKAALARQAALTTRKTHLSNLHHALLTPDATVAKLGGPIEIISLQEVQLEEPHPRIRALITLTKEAAARFVQSQLGPLTRSDCTRAVSFSDGSLIPKVGVGSAALHVPSRTLSPTNLGDPSHHTVYEAELVGIRLAADLAFNHRTRLQTSYWFFIDNQPSIQALT